MSGRHHDPEKAAAKKAGAQAARRWGPTAPAGAQTALAALHFPFGTTLNQVNQSGTISVPASADVDFSWGFYKQVRFFIAARAHAKRRNRAQCRDDL